MANVTSAKAVTAAFTLNTYAVTGTASPVAGGTVTCTPNPVSHGSTAACTAMANPGYTFSAFSGDCTGATCSMANVTAAKAVTAAFTLNNTYAVTGTASPVAGGTVTCTPNPVSHGSTAACTATANPGYTFSAFSGDCTGATCSITNVTAAKTVTASFAPTSVNGTSPTNTGAVSASMAGSTNGACGFASTAFVASATGASGNPPGITFPHGLFSFQTNNQCAAANGSITFTLTYPTVIPTNAKYWKYGPTADNHTAHWYDIPFTGAGTKVLTFTITDGGLGDDDYTANGTIVDDGGPGIPGDAATGATAIPTMSEWAMMLLVALMGGVGMIGLRSRRVQPF